MATLVPDSLETLKMEEVNGVIRSLTRKYTITGLSSTDYTVLLLAYIEVGLPIPGSFLTAQPFPTATPPGIIYPEAMLVLASRNFVLGKDKHNVDVELHYQHFMDGDNQIITKAPASPNGWAVPSSQVVYGKNRASVQQTKSNFYETRFTAPEWAAGVHYPPGSVVLYQGNFWVAVIDIPDFVLAPPPGPAGSVIGAVWGVLTEQQLLASFLAPINLLIGVTYLNAPIRRQIVVGHQFPDDDRNVPGQTIFQTGEITDMQPNDNFKLHGQVFIRNPRVIKKSILGAINSVPWMDGAAFEWICTEVTWEPLYVEWQWKMSFEFQHNEDSWLPTAIFNDQRNGRPPANLLPSFGYKQIHKRPEIDFENFFHLTFGCAPGAGA